MIIIIFELPVLVSRIYAFELELCGIAGKLKGPGAEIMIKLNAMQHLQGPCYTIPPSERIM
jgi:hypothetical protein